MGLIINHKNGLTIKPIETEKCPKKYYLKKWYLKYIFKYKNGNNLEFKGWINTTALNKNYFPETLRSNFWLKANKTTIYKGEQMMSGCFDIGFGEKIILFLVVFILYI